MPQETEITITQQVSENLKKAGLYPIPVQTLNDEAEMSRYFGGTFPEFLEAVKALGAKALFMETLYLEEEEFFYDSGIEEYEEEDGEEECCHCDDEEGSCKCGCGKEDEKKESATEDSEEDETLWLDPQDLDGMDLSLLRPGIAEFDKYIGEECGVRITLPGVDHLEVEIFTDWYDRFAELADDACEAIESDPAQALKDMQDAYAKGEGEEEHI